MADLQQVSQLLRLRAQVVDVLRRRRGDRRHAPHDVEPEPLQPQMKLTAAMLINVIARGGDVFANVRSLVFDNHEPRARQYATTQAGM